MIIAVSQGLPAYVSGELLRGSALGLILTLMSGVLARIYRDPARDPLPLLLGLAVSSVLGSSIFKILQPPRVLSWRPYEPCGYIGYVLGSLFGLLLQGLACTILTGRGRRSRRRRG